MPAPMYDAADYLSAMQALLPRGRAWPRHEDAVLTRTLGALAPVYARLHARANVLLADAFPGTSTELLPEWEATLGLPDPCSGPAPTLAARRAQVMARLAAGGGQSAEYFRGIAATLGYRVTVRQFAPARAGKLRAGQPAYGPAWAHAWRVTAPAVTVRRFRAGQGAAGEALATWGNRDLECALRRIAPAHTVLQFSYGGA